jgi:hypothetical protein
VFTKQEIETKAATKIQSTARGFFAKKTYKIHHRPISLCTSYPVNISGNDPEITFLPTHQPTDRIALIGTSGLRTLKIACQLGSVYPKIFLIDNSQDVVHFWKALQQKIKIASSADGILEKITLPACVCPNCNSSTKYLKLLCEQYGFEKVKAIILHASVIAQDWADEKTFTVIGNITKYHRYQSVYVYASNIICYVDTEVRAKKILRNIERLNPDLTIHTDMISVRGGYKPQNVFLCAKKNAGVDFIYSKLTSTSYQPDKPTAPYFREYKAFLDSNLSTHSPSTSCIEEITSDSNNTLV